MLDTGQYSPLRKVRLIGFLLVIPAKARMTNKNQTFSEDAASEDAAGTSCRVIFAGPIHYQFGPSRPQRDDMSGTVQVDGGNTVHGLIAFASFGQRFPMEDPILLVLPAALNGRRTGQAVMTS
jgi:hypothetical protein